jgi:hypothetical protein
MSKFFMGCICLDITILQKMESEGAGEHFVEQADGSSHVVWTSAMSAYMLSNLASLVAEGIRTSTGFKKVHLNMCAKALNDYFKMKLTGEQVKNHLRTWKRRYAKINRLRKLSAASWNEDNYMITLDHEHYANYVQVSLFLHVLLLYFSILLLHVLLIYFSILLLHVPLFCSPHELTSTQ